MSKKLILFIALGLGLVLLAWFFQKGGASTNWLWQISQDGRWLLPLLTVSALLDSINPCAFSILLLTIAFLFSLGRLRNNILLIGGFYVFGIFVVYFLIGLGILQTLHLFNTPHFMAKIGSVVLLALGAINLLGYFFPNFPLRLRIPHFSHERIAALMERASLPAAFALGILVGLCEFPCTGGPYLAALGLLHDKATYISGLGYLLLYNIIFILPLVIVLLIASEKRLLEKVSAWQAKERKSMRLIGGIVMIALGVIIFLL